MIVKTREMKTMVKTREIKLVFKNMARAYFENNKDSDAEMDIFV